MDFQNISFQLNKNKNIGHVLFIVEGEKTEKRYLFYVLHKILGYQFIAQKRRDDFDFSEYVSPTSKNSKVYIAFANESNIKHISNINQYLDDLFSILIDKYNFNAANAAIYYIWDRDRKSNTDSHLIRQLFQELRSSRNESPSYRQGLLLLSYPSIEAFFASHFIEKLNGQIDYALGEHIKQYLNSIKLTNFFHTSEQTLIKAA